MLASFITVVSALAASAAALPGAISARETYANWPATNFQEGCSPVSSPILILFEHMLTSP